MPNVHMKVNIVIITSIISRDKDHLLGPEEPMEKVLEILPFGTFSVSNYYTYEQSAER